MHINNEPCLARHALVDLNPNELSSYLFMVNLDVMEVVILLTIYQMDYVIHIK